MVMTLAGTQVMEVAIEIERDGARFYEIAAEGRAKPVADLFKQLAGNEREHEHTFRDMLTRLGGHGPSQDQCRDYTYMKDLADSSVFAGQRALCTLQKDGMTETQAVEVGMGFEKDSILFYAEALGGVPSQDRVIIDDIIAEEKKHLRQLCEVRSQLSNQPGESGKPPEAVGK